MARERAQEKIGSGNEEFKRFEGEAVERHREQLLKGWGQKLEEMDGKVVPRQNSIRAQDSKFNKLKSILLSSLNRQGKSAPVQTFPNILCHIL